MTAEDHKALVRRFFEEVWRRLAPIVVPRRDGRLQGIEVYRLLREGRTPS